MTSSQSPNRVQLDNSLHLIPPTARAVRKTRPTQWIEVTLGVRRKAKLPELSALNRLKPAERKYMTHDELATKYGADPSAVGRIRAFAAANHLEVIREEPMSARMTIGGPVSAMSQAFDVELFDFTDAELGDFHARTGPVSLPSELAGDVTGVFGFSNQRHLRRHRHQLLNEVSATTPPTARKWFLPQELAPIYNFPGNDASGQCIALLEFGGGVSTSDASAFFNDVGCPEPDIEVIGVDGVSSNPAGDPETTMEVMLDIDVAGALAPGAKLAVYFSTFDEKGLIDALSAVISDTANKPKVVSISYGWAENQKFINSVLWSKAAIDQVNDSFLAVANMGVTVCVSTGDDGSEALIGDGRAHVAFPSSSPYVLAVGGTTLHSRVAGAKRVITQETVWNDGPRNGTGGGVSDFTDRPDWQKGIVPPSINPGHFAGRGTPDVAANGDPATGYFTIANGQRSVVGGTSASAPLWAALVARMNKALGANIGNFNTLLYSKIGPAGVLRDITQGDNDTEGLLGGQFAAGPGWDACTGWGSPDGMKLLDALK